MQYVVSRNKGDGWSLLLASDLHHLYCCHKAAILNRIFSPYNRSRGPNSSKSCFSFLFVFSLSGTVGGWGGERLVFDAHRSTCSPASLGAHRPSSARGSASPSECFQAIRLLFPLALPRSPFPNAEAFALQCTFRLCVGWCCGLASGSL